MTVKENSNKIYFPHLDVIRFVAAFMIVILHSFEYYTGMMGKMGFLTNNNYTTYTKTGEVIVHFIESFGIAVDIFFLLSGFLITYILIEEKKRFNKINIKNFMIRRSLRIWPLYFLLIAIAPFLVNWLEDPDPDYIYNLFFLNNFHAIDTKEWTFPFAHFWSICIEEHFYLVWPFVIAFIPLKKLGYAFFLILLSSIGYRLYVSFTMPDPTYVLFFNSFCRIDVLVIGSIGALFYSKKPFTFKLNIFVRLALFLLLIIMLSYDLFSSFNPHFLAGFKKYFPISIIAVLLLDYNFNPTLKFRLPEKSVFHYLGKISYGIYMYSNILLAIIVKEIMKNYETTNMYIYFGLVVLLSILIPIISYELFEKVFLRWSNKFKMMRTAR